MGDFYTHSFSGGMGDRLEWMTEFDVEVIIVFLSKGSSWPLSLIASFM